MDRIVMVIPRDVTPETSARFMEVATAAGAKPPPVLLVTGGETRLESMRAGFAAAGADTHLVLVHDAARPFATPELFRRVAEAARLHGAAVPCVPITDTVKLVDDEGVRVQHSLDRDRLRAAQTPQGFRADWLRAGLATAGATTREGAALRGPGAETQPTIVPAALLGASLASLPGAGAGPSASARAGEGAGADGRAGAGADAWADAGDRDDGGAGGHGSASGGGGDMGPRSASADALSLGPHRFTDDAGLVEAAGRTVQVVPGEPENFKITTALDLALADLVAAARLDKNLPPA